MRATPSRERRQAGTTLIELMVALTVSSLAVGFIFRAYATTSVAYRTQAQISETQQSLRIAKSMLTEELRLAGYFSTSINTLVNTGITGHSTGSTPPAGVYSLAPVAFINSSSGPDELHITYADTSCFARVLSGPGPVYNSAESSVSDTSCFHDGDVAIAVRTANGAKGTQKNWGCILQLTNVQSSSGMLQHHPQAPYNDVQNHQCDHIAADWKDGNTVFMKFHSEGYRIKPNDPRGVLQMSPTAGLANDWQDLAFGFVDMQFAVQLYEPGDAVDADGLPGPDGTLSPEYDWYSGDNMQTLDLSNGKELLQVRVSFVARTVAEIEGVATSVTPSLLGDASRPANNAIGDHDSVTISQVTDKNSPYYGNYAYRMVTTVVDLRNLGVGRQL